MASGSGLDALWPGLRVMGALLLALAMVTWLVTRGSSAAASKALPMLRAQVTSWWRLLPPVFAAWATQRAGVVALVLSISLLAAWELGRLSEPGPSRRLQALLGVAIVVQWWLLSRQAAIVASGLMLALSAVGLGASHAGRQATSGPLGSNARDRFLFGLFALQAAGVGCLAALPVGLAPNWFLYLCIVTALNDIGQFLIGKRFGRHKLAKRISPHKTWQGALGGMVISVLTSMAVGQALGLAPGAAGARWLAGMGLILGTAGLFGDLLFSAAKRRLGLKDFGQLIPGHGGILDRVDSLVLTAPSLLLALHWTSSAA